MLISSLSAVESLRKTEVRARPVRAEAMVIVDGMIVVRLPGGKFWCSWRKFNKYAHVPGTWNGDVHRLLTGLHALGLVTADVLAEHMELARRATRDSNFRYDVKRLEELAAQYGFKAPRISPEKASEK